MVGKLTKDETKLLQDFVVSKIKWSQSMQNQRAYKSRPVITQKAKEAFKKQEEFYRNILSKLEGAA